MTGARHVFARVSKRVSKLHCRRHVSIDDNIVRAGPHSGVVSVCELLVRLLKIGGRYAFRGRLRPLCARRTDAQTDGPAGAKLDNKILGPI
jgi:hypothetical protein